MCRTSLSSLKKTVTSACADLSFEMGATPFDAERILDFYTYKYNLTCLSSGSTWCALEERKWFLEYLPSVTWPEHTQKWYPDWSNDPINGTNAVDENGTTILPYNTVPPPVPTFDSGIEQALDYLYHGPGPASGRVNPNSTMGLEYDEYPLEIQCSSCFLQRFRLGFMSRWGETFNEVKGQAWDNMQKNCNFKEDLFVHPALKPEPAKDDFAWDSPNRCAQTVTFPEPPRMNCSMLSARYKISTGSFRDLNKGINCAGLGNGTYCLPQSCEVAMQWYEGGIPALDLIGENGPYKNISFTQFVKWNSAAIHMPVFPGDYICVGPLGGSYVPPLIPGMSGGKPVYTTTAVPAKETPPGTVKNCGKYYDTVTDDYCEAIAMNFTITFDDLRAMNPQLDGNCTNLWANASYCVATVKGGSAATTVPITSTNKPTMTTSSSDHTRATIAPPAPTQTGAAPACYEWYTAVQGDSCWSIYTKFAITFDQLKKWNPILDDSCGSLWPDYAYCVQA
ncbi:carbohydrate-binding module family 50 protein [Periconia macrospinosa]|uniref:Carbohydrate-binding module family 50 protein n=1 Tax=Periconia macrospinosa TaxID=97972 RepID=A0A2V1ED64_9PLEO|nr:carbohydrate-binding module family 50 protein [Periconia macrospinosa]